MEVLFVLVLAFLAPWRLSFSEQTAVRGDTLQPNFTRRAILFSPPLFQLDNDFTKIAVGKGHQASIRF
jgi:hypothetical protein